MGERHSPTLRKLAAPYLMKINCTAAASATLAPLHSFTQQGKLMPNRMLVPAAATSLAAAQPWNMFAEFGRQQVALATEGAAVLFQGFEAMRKIQEQAAHQVCMLHETAAEKLKKAGEPEELLKIQSELLRFDVEATSGCWQQLAAAALEMQAEMLGCAAHLADAQTVLEAASAVAHLVGDSGAAELRRHGSQHAPKAAP